MKKFWIALLACLTFACLMLGVGCGSEAANKLAFNEMYLEEIELGDPIMLDEYIDPSLTDDYSAILTNDETGEERDLKTMGQWTTDVPGTYTLTYTVHSGDYKGTISTKINVYVPNVTWKYSTPTLVYRAGDKFLFNQLKRELNLTVKSYYPWEFFVKEVQYGSKRIDLTGKTSYVFPQKDTYTFTFGVKTEDGQQVTATQQVKVRAQQVLLPGAEEWLADNNATVYDYTTVSADGRVEMEAGYYNGSYLRDNVPYLAFNGAEGSNGYGDDTYVMVDFTGKNLPQVAFFAKTVTSSLTDGEEGIYISNGVTKNDGALFSEHDSHRLTVFGPNKVGYGEFDNKGRMWNTGNPGSPCGMSYVALDDNCQYRYIVGFSDAQSDSVTISLILINMTTQERVFYAKQKMTGYSVAGGSTKLDLDEDYFTGSIVLYGRYGKETVWDKVYAPIQGVSDILDLDPAAEFKSGFAKNYELNTTVNVSDYINIPDGDYEFTVTDPLGNPVAIAADGSFTYTMSGTYRLRFDPKTFIEENGVQKDVRPSSTTVRVLLDPTQALAPDYLEKEGILSSDMIKNTRWTTNSVEKYVKEGTSSLKIDAMSPDKTYGLVFGISRDYMNYLFLSESVDGITFEVYSEKTVDFKLYTMNGQPIAQDYTGTIQENTWKKFTLTRALFAANAGTVNTNSILAISFNSKEGLPANSAIYVDNVQLVLKSADAELSAEGQAWLNANNATAYGYQSIDGDGGIVLNSGYLVGDYNKNFVADSVPYIAFNGENGNGFGANTYIMADFTGKNLPQIAFFCDEVTPSLLDGKKGFYIHNGLTLNDGGLFADIDSGRLTLFGPNKVAFNEFDNRGRIEGATVGASKDNNTPSPISYRGLEDDCQYRYIVGFSNATNTTVKIHILLINLTTAERVFDYTRDCSRMSNDGGSQPIDFTGYFTGSIVLYGRYGVEMKWDKIWAPITNVNSIYDLDEAASFKGSYKKQFEVGDTVNVADYIDVPTGEYEFTVIDPDGEIVSIGADGSFQYTKEGTYRLIFDPKQGDVRANAIEITPITGTRTEAAKTFMSTNNMDAYGFTSIDDNMQVSLEAGTFQGGWDSITSDNVPYLAYNGNYGVGSYVVADFTGKNVPQLCFFVKEVSSSLVDKLAGFYVHTGMVRADGTAYTIHDGGRVTFLGPNKVEFGKFNNEGRVGPQHGYKDIRNNGEIVEVTEETSPLSVNGLEEGVHYRYAIGIKSAEEGKFVLEQILINLDTNTEVVKYVTEFTGSWITADYISGSIVMYGRYNVAITLDKVYAAYTNVAGIEDIDLVKAGLGQ